MTSINNDIPTINHLPLAAQRQALRRQLLAQRQLITQQIGPVETESSGFPRSMTMRFLIRRPEPAVRLLGEFASLLIGMRVLGSLPTALLLAGMVRFVSTAGSSIPQLPAPQASDNWIIIK